jgi:ribosomal protein L20
MDRKILAEIAVADMGAFGQLAQTAKSHLGA